MELEEQLEPDRARELIAANEVEVLDVRGEQEWHEKRIAGARRVDAGEIDAALEWLDAERPLLIVCGNGDSSGEIAAKLREDGREAACLDGGIDAWESEKLALQPSDDVADDAKV
jgi:rhodanese-related sulfurtransferase